MKTQGLSDNTPEVPGSRSSLSDQFLLTAVHDARSLLRRSLTGAQMLAQGSGAGLDTGVQNQLAAIIKANHELDRFLCRLSDYANAGQPRPGRPLPLRVIVQAAVSATESRNSISIAVAEAPPGNALVSPSLQIVLEELLDNAVKFRKDGPAEVRLETAIQNGSCSVAVHDAGIGVDAQFLERVFEPFQRLHPRDQYSGFGLGLAISRRIVETLGGEVSLRSGQPSGCTALVVVPRSGE